MNKSFYLQLFADDAAADKADTAAPVTGEAGKPTGKESAKEPEKVTKAEAKYTDEDVDKIIARKVAEMEKKKQREMDEAKKLAEMNAQQKAEYERDQLRKELDDYKHKDAISEMTKTARKMLSDGGISINDELLAMMVTTDAKETKAAIDGFSKAFTEAVEKAVKERLKGEPPRKGAGGVAAMTKAQIMAIKDPELRQKKMLENKELFNF